MGEEKKGRREERRRKGGEGIIKNLKVEVTLIRGREGITIRE